jgi:hypothetical protein
MVVVTRRYSSRDEHVGFQVSAANDLMTSARAVRNHHFKTIV